MIQAKTDYCTPVPDDFQPDDAPGDRYEAWCAGKTNWVEAESVIHTYYDDWYLTGMSIREDHGLEAGIVFENPNYALNHGTMPTPITKPICGRWPPTLMKPSSPGAVKIPTAMAFSTRAR